MAVLIESSYGKTIGLPGYSSHKFNLSIKTEVADLSRIGEEAERVYQLLQKAVDDQMVNTGLVPSESGNRELTDGGRAHVNGNGSSGMDRWNCSDKQRELILRIVDENHLDRKEVDELARTRFGAGVKELNKLAASGLIDELLEKYGNAESNGRGYRSQTRRPAYAGRRRG